MKLKKMITGVMAAAMVLSMSTAAFAEEKTYEDMNTVTVSKTYTLTNPETTSPAETFGFSTLTCTGVEDAGVGVTEENAPVPTIDSVSYTEGEAGSATATKNFTITLPSYNAVGVYTYTFNERNNGIAGVTYREDSIILKVTVIEQDGKVRVATVHTESEGNKSASFNNTYSAGSLAVTKTVAGNMGDHEKEFNVTVTLRSDKTVNSTISYTDGIETYAIAPTDWNDGTATATITLKHNETVTFTNIPYDVTYGVEEKDYSDDKYTVAYDGKQTGRIGSASTSTTITNTKSGTVDTGINLDSLPYIMILAVVAMALVVLFGKKRMTRNN